MFEYMDGIVDAVKELGQAAVDVAVFVTNMHSKSGVDNNSASMDIAVCDMEKGA